jgi:hypothetical protein
VQTGQTSHVISTTLISVTAGDIVSLGYYYTEMEGDIVGLRRRGIIIQI